MKAVEFGAGRRETVLLLHGGGLSWWNYREAAQLLEPYFHVILPVLDGHAGSGRAFVSMENSASELLSWIDEQFGGQILLAGGLSLGGQILLEMDSFMEYSVLAFRKAARSLWEIPQVSR